MDKANWTKVKEVFATAIELSGEDRAAFLNTLDADILPEIEKLLSAHENAAEFIEKPLLVEQNVVADKNNNDIVGEQIANYLITEKLGAGGMGAVYLAKRLNSDFKQKLALKIIKRGMDSEAILQRFSTERRILSTLKHPNIAQLIDGGISPEGLPFFVMEFVDGKPLNAFCRENSLSLERRLEIFLQICSAVDHAHKNLVVHRDLKPSNIIVSQDGTPKLLDFGIAKLLSDDGFDSANTATQGRMFTPEYASPEQILRKSVTTATDVYSLGVVLFELLTQSRPFETKNRSYEEIIQSVCNTEPNAPSSARRTAENLTTSADLRNTAQTSGIESSRLRGDLDNIVLKALRKDPTERYGSVQQFAEDIQRFLNGLPVLARPQTISYRLGKYIRRHKLGAVAASLVTLSLVTGFSVATWQAIVAKRAQARAETRFNQVRELANTVLFDYYDKIKDLPGTIEVRQQIVSDAVHYLDNLAAENSNDLSLKRELVKAYERVAEVQFGLTNGHIGDSAGSLANSGKALALAKTIVESPNATVDDQKLLAQIYVSHAGSMGETGDIAADIELKRSAIEIYSRLFAEYPNDTDVETRLASTQIFIGVPLKFAGNFDEAVACLRRSAEMHTSLTKRFPDEPKYNRNVALSYRYLEQIYTRQNDAVNALDVSKRAVEIDVARLKANPDDLKKKYDLSRSYDSLAKSYLLAGNISESEVFTKKSYHLTKEVADANPKNGYYSDAFALSVIGLANVREKQNNYTDAVSLAKQACAIWDETVKRDESDVFSKANLAGADTQIGLNLISQNKNNVREAQVWLLKSEELWNSLGQHTYLKKFFAPEIEKTRLALQKCDELLKN